jgi:hypothetical protein
VKFIECLEPHEGTVTREDLNKGEKGILPYRLAQGITYLLDLVTHRESREGFLFSQGDIS